MPGRKSQYEATVHPSMVEAYAREGLKQTEIAKALGVSMTTFKKWLREHWELRHAWKVGRIPFKAEMENKMVSIAMDDKNPKQFAALKFILERRFSEEWKEKSEQLTRNVDVTDEMFKEFEEKLLK